MLGAKAECLRDESSRMQRENVHEEGVVGDTGAGVAGEAIEMPGQWRDDLTLHEYHRRVPRRLFHIADVHRASSVYNFNSKTR